MRIASTLFLSSFASRSVSSLNTAANPIRWGILSAGRISSDYVQAIRLVDGAEATAIAARSPSKAAEFASQHKIPTIYSSYHDLIRSPEIDVLYIGTIADHHVEWTKEAILAGKPVVVEKPMALCASDAKELVDLAAEKKVFLMEGMWTRCFPAMKKIREIVASNEIGQIVYVQGDFGYSMANNCDDDRIWLPYSGGVTLDIGMYIAQFGKVAFPDGKLKHVHASGVKKNGVDYSVMANITYERGQSHDGMIQFVLTGAANTEERLVLQGTKGRIVIEGPFHIPQKFRVERDMGRGEWTQTSHDFPLPEDPFGKWNNPGSIGFVHQINDVGQALRDGKIQCDSFSWEDSIEVAEVIDEILRQVNGDRKLK